MTIAPPLSRQDVPVANAPKTRWRKVLLMCGVVSPLFYIGLDALAASLYDGYSSKSQTISELSAVDAPTRPLWLIGGLIYALLLIALALGVWSSPAEKPRLRVVASAIGAVGLLGLVVWPFAPMHQREVLDGGGGTFSDTLHLALSAADMVLFTLAIAVGATALGRRFGAYSVATLVIVFFFGAIMGTQMPKVANNEPTPWLGVTERITVFTTFVWYGALGFVLMRRDRSAEAGTSEGPGPHGG